MGIIYSWKSLNISSPSTEVQVTCSSACFKMLPIGMFGVTCVFVLSTALLVGGWEEVGRKESGCLTLLVPQAHDMKWVKDSTCLL